MIKTSSNCVQHTLLSTATGLLASLLIAQTAFGHGYMQYPQARQQFCVDDGGYWWPDDGSNIPNAACRAAFLISGTVPFTQHHEFSANVANFNNIEAVKATVKDGELCAAGDATKRGMNLPHADWQKTVITPNAQGQLEIIFHASTPHNPSFWEFYLSKPGFDPAQSALNWHDLDLIDTAGNVPVESHNGHKAYRIPINLPQGRQGDAILFTRWQRDDAAGEGFYNCSDVRFENTTPPQWHDMGYYLPQGTEAAAGDDVWFRVFNDQGQEQVFEVLAITQANEAEPVWGQALAQAINASHHSRVQIGVRTGQGTIEYKSSDLRANKVWLSNNQYSFALEVKKPQDNLPPSVTLPASVTAGPNESVNITATASDPEGASLTYAWQVPPALVAQHTDQATVTVQSGSPTDTTHYTLSVSVSDGQLTRSATTQLTVSVNPSQCQQTDPNAGNYPAWTAGTTYTQGQTVSHQELVWEAKWWNSSQPGFDNEAWQLTSQVALGWQANRSYNAGDEVDHQGRHWRANWWTQAEPGSDGSWTDAGVAHCP